ncbi:MAG: hypothetical protein WKF75_15795 [Singulisphaera sp.]
MSRESAGGPISFVVAIVAGARLPGRRVGGDHDRQVLFGIFLVIALIILILAITGVSLAT